MKKNGLNKLLALLLALVMVLALAACGNQAQDNGGAGNDADVVTDGTVADGATVGQGKTAFTMEVTQLDGTTVTFTVNTDKETVGEALLELGVVAGDDTEYGLYVKTVNGVTLDYDTQGAPAFSSLVLHPVVLRSSALDRPQNKLFRVFEF